MPLGIIAISTDDTLRIVAAPLRRGDPPRVFELTRAERIARIAAAPGATARLRRMRAAADLLGDIQAALGADIRGRITRLDWARDDDSGDLSVEFDP